LALMKVCEKMEQLSTTVEETGELEFFKPNSQKFQSQIEEAYLYSSFREKNYFFTFSIFF
jgi:hypothetical protein